MSATTIRRKAQPARKAAAAQGTARKVRKAQDATGSLLGRVPLSEAQVQRVLLALILAVIAALVWFGASAAGLPSFAADKFAQVAADAGFTVSRVEVRGIHRMNELKVYERVLGERRRPMPRVDLAALRDDLRRLPWVKDARVSRQLPDTLVVDIVERTPHGVLRRPGGRLVLIDETGHELEPVAPDKVGRFLIVSGPGSATRVDRLNRLLDAVPGLRPQVREAEWIGNRRWNLTFRTGQVLALPEGDRPAASALAEFVRLDRANRLIGGRVAAFDMRAADRIYLRIPGLAREEAARALAAKRAKETP